MSHESWVLKAPHIITPDGPVLKDHALLVENGVIQAIASYKELRAEKCIELPNTILFPGLVNAHCHLELSQLPEPLPYPGSFAAWIEELGRIKLQMTAEQTEAAIRFGIQKVLEGGTTTIADHISVGTPLEPLFNSPLEGIVYIEVLGVEEKRAEIFYRQAMDRCQMPDARCQPEKFQIIPTPHSPYSLLPEIFSKVVSYAHTHIRTYAQPLSIHLSESFEEVQLFKENRGALHDFLATKGKTPPTLGETPVQYLCRMNLLPNRAMAIHANYLGEEDLPLLKERNISVVHCPGSHAYFEHDRFPLGLLEDGGINIALGTDSLASNHSLSMFETMRLALENHAELTPEAVLKMASVNGAKAHGRENEIGSLAVGKRANIIGAEMRYPKLSLLKNILQAEKTAFTMIRGGVIGGAWHSNP